MSAAKKDTGLNDALSFIMGKSTSPQEKTPTKTEPQKAPSMATEGPQKGPLEEDQESLKSTHVRISEADIKSLGKLARIEGTTPAALIRRAIKELLTRNNI